MAVEEPELSDEEFLAFRATARAYTVMILKAGPHRHMDGANEIIYAHGKRNVALHAAGTMPVVCPCGDGTEVCGFGIFPAGPEEVAGIMDGDPAIRAGIFVYELHPVRSFPGSTLPG